MQIKVFVTYSTITLSVSLSKVDFVKSHDDLTREDEKAYYRVPFRGSCTAFMRGKVLAWIWAVFQLTFKR